ncbi:MAG: SDR family NAD(P)-dependent oxidoreductase [Chitinophagales bacterium]
MKVLVTGASGFVGSYLCRYLLKEGFEVRALKRKTSDLSLLGESQNEIEWVEGDILEVDSLAEAMDGIEKVYHSAAVVSYSKQKEKALFKVNVEGTANVVNTALEKNVKKLLHVSSVAAIGKAKSDELLTEEQQWEEDGTNSPYGFSKYLAEMEVWRGMAEGLSAVIINPSFVLGAGKWSDSSVKIFQRVYEGLSFYPKGSNGYVDVRDVAKVAIELMESNINRQRFIVNTDNLSYRSVFSQIALAMGKKPPTIPLNGPMIYLGWGLDRIKSLFTGSEPVINRATIKLTQRNYGYSNEKLKDAINYEFGLMEKVIQETSQKMLEAQDSGKDFAILDLN